MRHVKWRTLFVAVVFTSGICASQNAATKQDTLGDMSTADTLTSAANLQRKMESYARPSKPAQNIEARLNKAQAVMLKKLGAEYGRSANPDQLIDDWRRYLVAHPPDSSDVDALIELTMQASYRQASEDLKLQAEKLQHAPLQKKRARIERKELEDLGAESNELATVELQGLVQKQLQILQASSTISKRMHDTAMAIIRSASD